MVEDVDGDTAAIEALEDPLQEVMEEIDELMTISLQAFIGVTGYQNIRVTGYHDKRPLQVLMTHEAHITSLTRTWPRS